VFIYNTSDFISPTTMSDVNKTKTTAGYFMTTDNFVTASFCAIMRLYEFHVIFV